MAPAGATAAREITLAKIDIERTTQESHWLHARLDLCDTIYLATYFCVDGPAIANLFLSDRSGRVRPITFPILRGMRAPRH
jgi:hypothetical protein